MQNHTDFTKIVIADGTVAAFKRLTYHASGFIVGIVKQCDKTVFSAALDDLLKKDAHSYNDFLVRLLKTYENLFVEIGRSFDFNDAKDRKIDILNHVFASPHTILSQTLYMCWIVVFLQ
jgi:hypothetical protein